jgi:hypothetical protein
VSRQTEEEIARIIREAPEILLPDDVATSPWESLLRTDENGAFRDEENIRIVLVKDPNLVGIVKLNEFSGDLILAKPIDGLRRNARRCTT